MPTMRQTLISLISRRYPFLSGCGTFANSKYIRFAAGSDGGEAWSRLCTGPKILVLLDDYVGKAVFFAGDLDRKISMVIGQIVRPGDTVIDIGANLGVVALQLAKLVGEGGVVHAFEPNPKVNLLLKQSIERNRFSNAQVHTCALGAHDNESMQLSFPAGNAGQGTLRDYGSSPGWDKIEVPVRKLSSLVSELKIGHVRLMKIDVEGFEAVVFEGAQDWLSTSPPDAIIFESNGPPVNGKIDPAISLLLEHGYKMYSITKQLFSLRLSPFNSDDSQSPPSHDTLAVHKSCEQEIVSNFKLI